MNGPEYPAKPYAEFTTDDRQAMRRYERGKAHARQGRTDLLGACPHYDAGHSVDLTEAGEQFVIHADHVSEV